jgi:hypothetical protein
MKISIDIKRVIITTLVCFLTAIIPQRLSTLEINFEYSLFFLFPFVILVTNIDRITTRKKYQAFLLSALLNLILFFFSFMLLFFLGSSSLGLYSFYFVSIASGLLALLINSIFIQMDNIKFGVIVTIILSVLIFPLTTYLRGQTIGGIAFFSDPITFFTVWQTLVGLAISLTIWTKNL